MLLLYHVLISLAAAAAKSLQSCPTLWDPIHSSPPGSTILGVLQARTLEWVAISFTSAWKWKVKVKSLSRVPLLATPWTAAYQAPPSMGFSRQEYWSGSPLPSPLISLSLMEITWNLSAEMPEVTLKFYNTTVWSKVNYLIFLMVSIFTHKMYLIIPTFQFYEA